MVQMSQKYRKLSLRLDNGALIGHSEKLLGDASGGPVLLPVDRAFSRGLVTEQQAKRLEALLVQMHSRAPNAAPLRSLSDINRKRKEPDYAQVALVPAVCSSASGSWMKRCFCADSSASLSPSPRIPCFDFMGVTHCHISHDHTVCELRRPFHSLCCPFLLVYSHTGLEVSTIHRALIFVKM